MQATTLIRLPKPLLFLALLAYLGASVMLSKRCPLDGRHPHEERPYP